MDLLLPRLPYTISAPATAVNSGINFGVPLLTRKAWHCFAPLFISVIYSLPKSSHTIHSQGFLSSGPSTCRGQALQDTLPASVKSTCCLGTRVQTWGLFVQQSILYCMSCTATPTYSVWQLPHFNSEWYYGSIVNLLMSNAPWTTKIHVLLAMLTVMAPGTAVSA